MSTKKPIGFDFAAEARRARSAATSGAANTTKRMLGVGETAEVGSLRLHRYATGILLMDLANAGKRGKRVEGWYLHSVHDPSQKNVKLDGFASALLHVRSLAEAKRLIDDVARDFPGEFQADARNERGVDVAPAGGGEQRFKTVHYAVEFTPRDFLIADFDDQANCPAAKPVKVSDAAKFAKWFNFEKMKAWTFSHLTSEARRAGIDVHSWCTID